MDYIGKFIEIWIRVNIEKIEIKYVIYKLFILKKRKGGVGGKMVE